MSESIAEMMASHSYAKTEDSRKCTCHPDDDPPRACPKKYALHECQTAALVDAMDQLLDDMGIVGTSVCMAAKAQARIAYEPFRDKSESADWLMPIEDAKRILKECDG